MNILSIVLLIVGFVLLIKGADYFVEGSSDLANKLKIPSMIIGLTIVAFGTSAPEAAVSVASAVTGSNAIAVSNIIGSNIFNMLVVVGATAVIYKITIEEESLKTDFPVLMISCVLLLIFLVTGNQISRIEGIIFLIIIIAYISWLIIKAKKDKSNMSVEESHLSTPIIAVYIICGLIAIVVGGDLVVNSAKDIALSLGMSETLVGLTIVAVGTSLPELITSITAALNKKQDIALGNAIGSSIFNILFILGLTNVISPIQTTQVMLIDTVVMIVLLGISYILAYDKQDFNKKDGIILLAIFIVYMIFIIIRN
ncbi:MAG: sodium:proton exchanger [Methanosphaera sp. SHI613]|jgi:cation:H+ antiporter|nr:MAG: sodium:proton exchanger [Methanosphaera sp. SHI613]